MAMSHIIRLPKRVMGSTWEDIERALGIRRKGDADIFFFAVAVPAGWSLQPCADSPYNRLLVNGDGTPVAKVFYKESFHAGDIQLLCATP